jgi:Mg-chelatase subunit ChlD
MTTRCLGNSRSTELGRLRALLLSSILGILGAALLPWFLGTVATVSAPRENNAPTNLVSATSVSTAIPSTTTVRITKTVDPSCPDTGGMVTICFTIAIKRPGLDVVLVQDVSGSMNSSAGGDMAQTSCLTASKKAAIAFAGRLQDTDRVAVVPYSTTAYVAQPLTTIKSDVTEIITKLKALDDWYTNIGEGIKVGHEALVTPAHYASETIKAIVLLSDGKANRPKGKAREYALEKAEAAADDEIKIYTIGLGSKPDEELLETIAITTGGEYNFAPEGSALEPIYLTIALQLHNLVITDILLPGVGANCSSRPDGLCVKSPGGVTTVTLPISDSSLLSTPLTLCFTATVNLDSSYQGPINHPDSGFCYQDRTGETFCDKLNNPTICVGGCETYLPTVMKEYNWCLATEGIVNGGFENGWLCWTHGGELSQTVTSTNPYSGGFCALLGIHTYDPGPNYDYHKCRNIVTGSAWIEQSVFVPWTSSPRLSFYYEIWTHARNRELSNAKDLFEVRINNVQVFSDMNQTEPYGCQDPPTLVTGVETIDLSAYRGDCIAIRFENWNRGLSRKYNTWTYVDDVRIDP